MNPPARPSEISRQDSNRIQIDAVSPFARQMKPYRFKNVPLLSAFSNRPGFGNGLGRRRVNGRCNRIENERGFICNHVAFDGVTPSASYTTPVETVNETGSGIDNCSLNSEIVRVLITKARKTSYRVFNLFKFRIEHSEIGSALDMGLLYHISNIRTPPPPSSFPGQKEVLVFRTYGAVLSQG